MSWGGGSMSGGKPRERNLWSTQREGLEGRRDVETWEGLEQSQQKRHSDIWVVELLSHTSTHPDPTWSPTQVYPIAEVSNQGRLDR